MEGMIKVDPQTWHFFPHFCGFIDNSRDLLLCHSISHDNLTLGQCVILNNIQFEACKNCCDNYKHFYSNFEEKLKNKMFS